MSKPAPTSGTPTPDEIRASLEMAGYPFEIRITEWMRINGMNPQYGWRLPVDGDGTTRELDIIGGLQVSFSDPSRDQRLASVGFEALVQAKRLNEGAFVGFSDEPVAPTSPRLTVGGWPSFRMLEADPRSLSGEPTTAMLALGNVFDPLNAAPYCVQWAVAHRTKQHDVRSDHEPGVFDDLQMLVNAAWQRMHGYTMFVLNRPAGAWSQPDMRFALPTLVLDAPLYFYNVHKKQLIATDRLTLQMTVETLRGLRTSIVDIVTEQGLPEWRTAYDASLERLKDALLKGDAPRLASFGEIQHRNHLAAQSFDGRWPST